jgi:tetratricopeptide (TPR) repeat protein
MSGGNRRPGIRRAFCALGLLLVLAGCDDAVATAPPPLVAGKTVTGNYLAARHARSEGAEADAAEFLLAALKKSPDDRVLLGRAWLVLTLDGRVSEAVEIARRSVAAGDEAPMAHIVVAVGDIRAGRFAAAVDRLATVPQSPLSSFLVPVLQAWAEFGAGHRDKAMASLEKLKATASTTPLYDVHAAWLSDVAGDPQAALTHARAAVQGQSEPWLRLAVLAGGIFQRAGQKDEAQAVYDLYAKRHSASQLLEPTLARLKSGKPPPRDIADARAGAAEALFDASGIVGRQNNRDTALVLGQLGLYLRPDFPPLQILVGDMLENAERWADANRFYQAIDRADPLAVTARLGIARNLDRLDRFDEAQAALRQMAADRPNDPEPFSELGDLLRRHERFGEAVEAYDQAVARIGIPQPRHWRLLYARGIALERSKQWSRAEADFLEALRFEPEQPFVLNYLAYSWVEQGKNLEKAETMLRKAVELQPNDGYIIDSLGWVMFRLGRYDEAVVHLERAVEIRPEDAAINDHLGDAYWAVGRQREARFQWEAALVGDPEPDLKAAIEKKLLERPLRAVTATNAANAAGPEQK